jgi:hypothetical protein
MASQAAPVVHPDPSSIERRVEPRVSVDVPARMKSLSPLTSTGPSIRVRVVEISHSGMKVLVAREFQPGALVQIMVGNGSIWAQSDIAVASESSFKRV